MKIITAISLCILALVSLILAGFLMFYGMLGWGWLLFLVFVCVFALMPGKNKKNNNDDI